MEMKVKQEDREKNINDLEQEPLNADDINNGADKKKKSFAEYISHIKDNITVEPLLAGLIVPSIISRFAMTNLNLDKACRVNKGFGDVICDAVISKSSDAFGDHEKEIQKLISSIDIWKGLIHTLLPCILVIFLGAWSDRTGKRKICILLPIFGELLTSINNIVNVYFFYEIPVQITVFLEVFFSAVTGGWMIMFLGVFSYISDITSHKNRTFRVGLVNICMTAGIPLGLALSGILLQKLGYYGIFLTTTVLFLLILVYGMVCLKEPEIILKEKGLAVPDRTANADVSFFNLAHVGETVAVAFKSRPGNKRVKVILTLFIVFILFGPQMAENHIMYLFLRNRLNWDMVKFSIFATYSVTLHSMGALFSIIVFSRRLQWDDSLLGLISVTSKFVGSFVLAFATTDKELYCVPLIEIFNATTFTSLKSIVTKQVSTEETARVISLFSLVEIFSSLLFNPLYAWLYMVTLHTYSGAVYLVSAAMVVPAALIFMFFILQNRATVKAENKAKIKPETESTAEKVKEDTN